MAEVAPRTTVSLHLSFFFWTSAVMAAVVFGGFAISYFVPMATGDLPALPPVVHLHGLFYFAWMLLLVVQSLLVNTGNVALHRSLGTFGIGVATALTTFGAVITVLAARRDLTGPLADQVYGIVWISVVALVVFIALFVMAIRNVRDSQAHRRYILLATLPLMIAALNRVFAAFGIGFESFATYVPKYLLADAFVVAMLVHDRFVLGSVHRATAIGGALNVIPQLLHAPLVGSGAWVAFTHWLAGLGYYGA
jgi:hypothetical protein